MPAGRPTKYTQELADTICRRIMEGESLRSIVSDDGMPNRSSVHLWLSQNKEFSDQYVRAKDNQADTLADDLLFIADNAEDINKARLQVDTRKWVASKLKPKKYGDKLDLDANLSGNITIQTVKYDDTDTPQV
jgi:hypothetical protein